MHHNSRLNPTELKILANLRVGIVKAALQFTQEQKQFWPAVPAVEEASRTL
jgi:hypothetical protein